MVERRRYGWQLCRADRVPAVRCASTVQIRAAGASASGLYVGLPDLRDGDVVAQIRKTA